MGVLLSVRVWSFPDGSIHLKPPLPFPLVCEASASGSCTDTQRHRHRQTDTRPSQLSSTLGCYAINNWTNHVTAGTSLHKTFLYDRRIVVVHTNKIKRDDKQINIRLPLVTKLDFTNKSTFFLPEAAHTI